jgi:hypothetical protein
VSYPHRSFITHISVQLELLFLLDPVKILPAHHLHPGVIVELIQQFLDHIVGQAPDRRLNREDCRG